MRLLLTAMSWLALPWVAACDGWELGLPPPLVVGPATLDFGDVAVGASAERALLVTNAGSRPVEASVAAPAAFAVAPASFALAPQETKALTVTFRAREPGEIEGLALTLGSDAPGARDLEVPLRAFAKRPPEIAVEPLSISFGAVALASRGRAIVGVANRGELPLHVSNIGSPFPFRAGAAEFVVEPGERRTVEVTYAPDAAGEHDARLLVRSDDLRRGLVVVNLTGSGVEEAPRPVIGTSAEALDFGRVRLGESREQALLVRNEGADPLHVTSLGAVAPFSAPSRGRRLAPGRSVRIAVSFAPDREGEQLVPLMIYSNDPERPVLLVSLLGEGTQGPSAPAPEVAAAAEGDAAAAAAALPGESSLPAPDGAPPEGPEADPVADAGAPTFGEPLVGEGGYVYVGTLRSALSASNVASWSFDPASGLLSVAGFAPTTVQFPFGQTFGFAPVDIAGRVSSSGDFSAPGTLTMVNENGTTMEIHGTFTTGDATYETNGIQATVSGSPLDGSSEGRIVFVGVGPDGTPAEKLPVVIEIPVAPMLQAKDTGVHAR